MYMYALYVFFSMFVVAAKYRFGEKATPSLVSEKIKRALQNMSDERKHDRRKGTTSTRRGGDNLEADLNALGRSD